ncbi:MAG: TIGR04283 family arsenosugar biosynthesis glycosyltransferase, partial [Bacteroidota bacterium]
YLRQVAPHNTEIIVVDGGSTDGTPQLAKTHDVSVLHARKGRAPQMNAGAARARGQYLYFLHADTYPPTDFADHFTRIQAANIAAAGFRLRFDYQSTLLRFLAWCTGLNLSFLRFGDQSLLITRRLFFDVGAYREDYLIMEGNEIIRRIKRQVGFHLIPACVTTSARKYRQNGTFYLQSIYVLLFTLERAGVKQPQLWRMYRRWVK